MSPTKKPVVPVTRALLDTLVADFAELVPSVEIDLFRGAADEIAALIDSTIRKAIGVAVHGSRMAGKALSFEDEERQEVQWMLVGKRPDGKNCPDCLILHGQRMTYAQFLDTKYTTQCNGNCRCDAVAVKAGRALPLEPLTQDEIDEATGDRS